MGLGHQGSLNLPTPLNGAGRRPEVEDFLELAPGRGREKAGAKQRDVKGYRVRGQGSDQEGVARNRD